MWFLTRPASSMKYSGLLGTGRNWRILRAVGSRNSDGMTFRAAFGVALVAAVHCGFWIVGVVPGIVWATRMRRGSLNWQNWLAPASTIGTYRPFEMTNCW